MIASSRVVADLAGASFFSGLRPNWRICAS